MTFFDIAEGYVEIEVDHEVVNTPLPLDPASRELMEPELVLSSRFGSNVPLGDGAHSLVAVLYDLQGRALARDGVNVTVSHGPDDVHRAINYTLDGNAQAWSMMLNQAVLNQEPLKETFAHAIETWPPPGPCGHGMQSVPGFPAPDTYAQRPLVVYVCPPDKCGGSLDWLVWQPEAAAACGGRCLWVQKMECVNLADVVLLSCYAAPPAGFGKWPHQIWAYLCMESDTRRRLLSKNLLRHMDIIANYRLHHDFPGLSSVQYTGGEAPWHVTVTYASGNAGLYHSVEPDPLGARPYLAAYLVSNCGRPRDLYASRLIEALGADRVHSYGRCFNNRDLPQQSRHHGSVTLAVLRQYKFTIAIENFYSHDYVSER